MAEGNHGPGYEVDPDGDLVFFASPSLLGYGRKTKGQLPANIQWEQEPNDLRDSENPEEHFVD